MTDEDFDLETFVDLFDTAMSSDNPTVRRAFKNLMMVTALAEAENGNKTGPLRNVVEKIKSYESRLSALEWQTNIKNSTIGTGGVTGTYVSNNPTWISTMTNTYPSTYTTSIGAIGSSTFTLDAAGANGPSASTDNYMSSTNYDFLYDNLQSKN